MTCLANMKCMPQLTVNLMCVCVCVCVYTYKFDDTYVPYRPVGTRRDYGIHDSQRETTTYMTCCNEKETRLM